MKKLGLGACLAFAAAFLISGWATGQDAKTNTIRVRVLMPQSDAKLYLSDQLMREGRDEFIIESPPLDPKKRYYYEIKADWEPNNYTKITRKRRLSVVPGKIYTVDLRKKEGDSDHVVVRYVPTPWDVVDEMCKLAKVKKGDVVFDLGCGDGRICIQAVKKYGAKRGIGVDIDPERIKDSRDNARRYKVTKEVQFRHGDVFKKIPDLADATVVMLYMGQDINLHLRPILKKRLKPGTRVVSHRFTMGDWTPDKSIKYKSDDRERPYNLHLWTIKKTDKDSKAGE